MEAVNAHETHAAHFHAERADKEVLGEIHMMRFGASMVGMMLCALIGMTARVHGQPSVDLEGDAQIRLPVFVGRFDTVLEEPLKEYIDADIWQYKRLLRATQRIYLCLWDTNEVSMEQMWQLPQVRVSFVNIPVEILKESAGRQSGDNEGTPSQDSELVECLDRNAIVCDRRIDEEGNAQPPIGFTSFDIIAPYQRGFRGMCFLAADKERIGALREEVERGDEPLVFGEQYFLYRIGTHLISPNNNYAKFRLPETMQPASLYTVDLDIGEIFEYEEVLRLEKEREARAKLTMGSVVLSRPDLNQDVFVRYFDPTRKVPRSVDLIDHSQFLIPKDGRGSLLVFGPKEEVGVPVSIVARDVPSNVDSIQFPREQDLVVDPNRLIKFAVQIPDSYFDVEDPNVPWISCAVGLVLDDTLESLHFPLVVGGATVTPRREPSETDKTVWLSFVPGDYYLVVYPNIESKSVLLMPISLAPQDNDKVFRISEMPGVQSFSKVDWQRVMGY